jgi:hypothetical protein
MNGWQLLLSRTPAAPVPPIATRQPPSTKQVTAFDGTAPKRAVVQVWEAALEVERGLGLIDEGTPLRNL